MVTWISLGSRDALLVFSVGGGDASKGVSGNIVRAIDLAVEVGADVFALSAATAATRAPSDCVRDRAASVSEQSDAHTEGLCAVIWHLLVSHPALAQTPTKWESI